MRFISYIIIFFTLFASTVYAAGPSTELGNLLNGLRTMQANFVQTTYDNKGKEIQKSYGQMALDRPGKFRWQVKKPIPQLIIANQQRLWIYDPDLEQVTIRSLGKDKGEIPALLLSHVNGFLEKDYEVKAIPKNAPDWKYFKLTPRRHDSMFVNVVIGFKGNQIGSMSLVDHLGHSTFIEFRNSVINTSLYASLFTFKPPAKVDVIDETKTKS